MTIQRRLDLLAAVAGVMGASGVALAAASAHLAGGELSRLSAEFLILHAGALIGVAAQSRAMTPSRAQRLLFAGAALALGTMLFCGDLADLAFLGRRLFPFAAPAGGMLMIASWLALAAVFIIPE